MNDKDIRRIAAEADCDQRTVEALYDGRRAWRKTREAVEAAARKLRLAPPPKEKAK